MARTPKPPKSKSEIKRLAIQREQPTEQDLDAMLLGFEHKQRVGKIRAIVEGARGVVASAQTEVDLVPLVPREIREDLKEAHAALARARERLGVLYKAMPPFGK